MSEIVDPRTGELVTSAAESAVLALLEIPEGVLSNAITPAGIDQLILDLSDTLTHVGAVIVVLYEQKHRAEEKYQGDFADFMVMHEKSGAQLARQFAIAKTKTQLHELNLAKEQLRYAEEMQKALQNRSFGLMNIGKRIQTAFNMSGGSR